MAYQPDLISQKVWAARILIGIVLFFNVQCAILFMAQPGSFIQGFQLSGIPGITMVQGLGILFVMWNIPYIFAAWHPIRFRISLFESLIMQGIGLSGETLLLINLPSGYDNLVNTAIRFIIFDGAGFIFLLLAVMITKQSQKTHSIL